MLAVTSSRLPSHTIQINSQRFHVYNVPGDGSCFFHCISLVLTGGFSQTLNMRQQICGYIVAHWDEWKGLVQICHGIRNPYQYEQAMVRSNGWASQCEIWVATRLYDLNINLIQRGVTTEGNVVYSLEEFVHDQTSTTYDLLLAHSHYQVLKRVNTPRQSASSEPDSKKPRLDDNNDQDESGNKETSPLPPPSPETKATCFKLGINYEPSIENESNEACKNRRKRNKARIASKIKDLNKDQNSSENKQQSEKSHEPTKQTIDGGISNNDSQQESNSFTEPPPTPETETKCKLLGIKYEAPQQNEVKKEATNRRRRNKARIANKIRAMNRQQEQNVSNNQSNASNEGNVKQKQNNTINQQAEPLNQQDNQLPNDSGLSTNLYQNKAPPSPEVHSTCRRLGIFYEAPTTGESKNDARNRRRRNKAHIDKRVKELKIDLINIPEAPPLNENDHFNKAMDAIRAFDLEQMSYELNVCEVCQECRIQTKMASPNLCLRCKNDKHPIKFFSKENNMDPGTQPDELKDMTDVEQQLIAMISPCFNVHHLKHGGIASAGHCVTFPQEINAPAKIFPRLPHEVNIVRVRRKGTNDTSKEFKVRRQKVAEALIWLKANNPAYHDITIDQNRLNQLPLDSDLPNINTMEYTANPKPQSSTDQGPASEQLVDDSEVDTNSGVLLPDKTVNEQDNLNDMLKEIVSGTGTEVELNKRGEVVITWPARGQEPINEFTTVYFFTMAFPALFPYALGDFHINRERTCSSLGDWAEHLLWYQDGRFASHPYFKFIIHNMVMRKRATDTGNFIVTQKLGDAHLTVSDLQDKLNANDSNLAKQILYFGGTLRGTEQFWALKRKELRSFIQYMINEGFGLPSYFVTGSCAEFHFPPLRRLLQNYLKLTTGKDVNLENKSVLSKVIQSHSHIVAKYFDLRTTSYFEKVMKPVFGVGSFWYRQEFAKSRGMIHWHGLCWRTDGEPHNLLYEALQKGLGKHEEAEKLAQWAEQELGMSASHPGGKDENGQPRKDTWPPPEGTAPLPPDEDNPLAKLLMQVSDSQNSLDNDHLLLTNRVNLHRCSSYCLRYKSSNSKEKTCRFEFGTESNPGKPLRENHEIVKDKNGFPRLEMARDHPALVQHSRYHTQAWRANGDISVVLSKSDPKNPSVDDLIAVERYITGYACKGSEGTGALSDLFSNMVNSSEDPQSTAAKSVVTKLLIHTVKRDISSCEASFELSMLPLYRSSHSFQTVSLSGARKLERTGETLTKNTPIDKYIARDADDRISLYRFVCRSGRVPVISGCQRASWPLTEEYARTMLVMHWPGWHQISDIIGPDQTWLEKFQIFLEMESCPTFVKADVERARRRIDDIAFDSQSDEEQDLDDGYELPDWAENVRPLPGEFTENDFEYNDGGDQYDWSKVSESLNLPADLGLKWTENTLPKGTETSDSLILPHVNTDSMNDQQLLAYRLVMNTLQLVVEGKQYEPLRMVVGGTAGTGKSFLIKCIVKSVRLLFKSNKSVQVLCPTGNSASNISGMTYHSFLKTPNEGKTNELTRLEGLKAKTLQDNCEGLQVLLIDERSMIGSMALGWMSFMVQCGVQGGKNFGQSWGGLPVVVFLGDDIQLPPVMDPPIYHCTSKSPAAIHGCLVWQEFTTAVVLTTIVRQNIEQQRLRDTLMALREYKLTDEQAKWLQSFQWHRLKTSHGNSLLERMNQAAFFIFSTHTEVWKHNKAKLLQLNDMQHPIARCLSIGTGPHASKSRGDTAGGLQQTLYICKSARVTLSVNISVPCGLYNGAMGTIIEIMYLDGRKPKDGLPDLVLVEFDHYNGPAFLPDFPKIVPIVPLERRLECPCKGCKRTQIPLRLGWASTIHRCQGLTIGSGETHRYVVIDPGTKAFESRNPGTLFVALSRAKSAGDELNDPDFAFHDGTLVNPDRLCHKVTTERVKARAREVDRIASLARVTHQRFAYLLEDQNLGTFISDILAQESE